MYYFCLATLNVTQVKTPHVSHLTSNVKATPLIRMLLELQRQYLLAFFSTMLLKRQLTNKNFDRKYKALKVLKKGMNMSNNMFRRFSNQKNCFYVTKKVKKKHTKHVSFGNNMQTMSERQQSLVEMRTSTLLFFNGFLQSLIKGKSQIRHKTVG